MLRTAKYRKLLEQTKPYLNVSPWKGAGDLYDQIGEFLSGSDCEVCYDCKECGENGDRCCIDCNPNDTGCECEGCEECHEG